MNRQSASLEMVLNDPAFDNSAVEAARNQFTSIARASDKLKFPLADQFAALRDGYPALSGPGILLSVLSFITKYLGSVGAVVVLAIGIVTLLRLVKQGYQATLGKIFNVVNALYNVAFHPIDNIKGIWSMLFGGGTAAPEGAKKDGDTYQDGGRAVDMNAFSTALSMSLPLPMMVAVTALDEVIGASFGAPAPSGAHAVTTVSPTQAVTALVTPPAPGSSAFAAPLAPVVAAAPSNRSSLGSVASDAADVMKVLGGLDNLGVFDTIMDLFTDQDSVVRDGEFGTVDEFRDAIVRDTDVNKKATIATLVALGVNPRQFAALNSAVRARMSQVS